MKAPKVNWSDLKKHRLSLILILITIMGIGVFHFVWVAPGKEERKDLLAYIEQQGGLVRKYQEKLSKTKGLKKKLQEKERELNQLQEGLFQGNDPYQLAATLAEPFSEGSQELEVKSYQVVSTKEYGLYQEVKIRFSLRTSIKGLHQFLENLEKNSSAVLVESLDIRSLRRKRGSDLSVNVVLAALMEKGSKS
jgi:hypothetical protein